jgi:hypothetical protein
LNAPFEVVHVDAHSDLGSGWLDDSPRFVETELLALPLEKRSDGIALIGVHSGNYLTAAVANRWLSRLTYAFPTHPQPPPIPNEMMRVAERLAKLHPARRFEVNDLPTYVFRDDNPETARIQLKRYAPNGYNSDAASILEYEPELDFAALEKTRLSTRGFTHMVIAQSPAFTPAKADFLIDVIAEYFDGC